MKVMNFINHFRTLQTRLISLLIFHFTSINDVLFTYSCIVENLVEFNISWLRGCHPLLNVGDLSIEASEKLGLLLDQLRSPTVKSLSSLVVVVLINRYVVYPSCILKHVQFFWLGKYLSSIFFITIIFLILLFSLSAIARKRPPYYGRILPVLLGLDPPTSVIEGMHISGPQHALKNALLACLKCTHPGASPVFHLH